MYSTLFIKVANYSIVINAHTILSSQSLSYSQTYSVQYSYSQAAVFDLRFLFTHKETVTTEAREGRRAHKNLIAVHIVMGWI